MRNRLYGAALVALGSCLLPFSTSARAQGFDQNPPDPSAGPTVDTTTSLGQFTIVVNPVFAPYVSTAAGYSAGWTGGGANLLTSPLLYDPTTSINRSATVQAGSPAYTGGAHVGSAGGPLVSNSSISAFPTGYTPPANNTDLVFTQINSFDLTPGGVGGTPTNGPSVQAGSAGVGLPASSGEVISNSSSGNSANDFPAKSFFDIFVDVNLPGLDSTGVGMDTLTNSSALIVQNPSVTALPPTVVYTHGNSSAVPLMFSANDPNFAGGIGATAGEVFGVLTLSGHGVGYTNGQAGSTGSGTDENTGQPADSTTFESQYYGELADPADLMPLPVADASWSNYVPVVPEPTSLSLFAIGVASLGVRGRRKA